MHLCLVFFIYSSMDGDLGCSIFWLLGISGIQQKLHDFLVGQTQLPLTGPNTLHVILGLRGKAFLLRRNVGTQTWWTDKYHIGFFLTLLGPHLYHLPLLISTSHYLSNKKKWILISFLLLRGPSTEQWQTSKSAMTGTVFRDGDYIPSDPLSPQ